jgi:hypothetical protein
MIKICMLQAFDLYVSKLLAGAATQAAELPRSGNSTSFQDSFSKPHAERSLTLSRRIAVIAFSGESVIVLQEACVDGSKSLYLFS